MSIYTPDGDARPGRTWAYGCIAALLLFVVLPIGLWAFGVFSSGARGAGNVIQDRNSSQNIEHWSAVYNGDWNTIKADQQKIQILGAAATAPNADGQAQIDYQGAQATCDNDVANLASDEGNTLGSVYIPADVPNPPAASTYCTYAGVTN